MTDKFVHLIRKYFVWSALQINSSMFQKSTRYHPHSVYTKVWLQCVIVTILIINTSCDNCCLFFWPAILLNRPPLSSLAFSVIFFVNYAFFTVANNFTHRRRGACLCLLHLAQLFIGRYVLSKIAFWNILGWLPKYYCSLVTMITINLCIE